VNRREFVVRARETAAVILAAAAAATLICGTVVADSHAPASDSVSDRQVVSFVACPVYRDTNNGRKSGCWLATDNASGVRYDISGGRSKPQIGRDALVEGVIAASADACGGQVLLPVHVSVLPTTCSAVMLPAEGFQGRVFQVPKGGYLPPANVSRPLPAGPYESRDWHIEFNFQSDFLAYQYSEVILDEAARYIRASGARQVKVIGYTALQPFVVSGRSLSESPELGEERAKMVGKALLGLGVDSKILRLEWHDDPSVINADDALAEPSKRRVTIRVEL
jgi:hypothetical protein